MPRALCDWIRAASVQRELVFSEHPAGLDREAIVELLPPSFLGRKVFRMGPPRCYRGVIAETNDFDFLTGVRVISLYGDESGVPLWDFVHHMRVSTVFHVCLGFWQ